MSAVTCDTSLLVPAMVAWHPAHETARDTLEGVTAIPAHVLLEAFSVLTRLPAPHRISPGDAAAVLDASAFAELTLPAGRHRRLLATLAAAGSGGGAIYDALIGATARHHKLVLLTRDGRARTTYDLVGVDYRLIT